MGLFSLGKKRGTSTVLLDIGSASVAGAYLHVQEGSLPILYYTARLPIEHRPEGTPETAMLRTLQSLCDLLIKEGAPALARETGSGRIDSILVSIAGPWQETRVRTQLVGQDTPFLFTKEMLHEIVTGSARVPEGRIDSGETVIATLLNGYEVANPFHKKVRRAELVILSSSLDKAVAGAVERIVRSTYHTHAVSFVAFAPVAYAVFRDLYPHEKDFLILDVSGEGSDLACVRHGLLMDVAAMPYGSRALLASAPGWLTALTGGLRGLAARHPLPRTLFVLADDDARDALVLALSSPELHGLWLSDEPLRVVPVLPAQFAAQVQARSMATGDIFLAVLALYAGKAIEPVLPPPEPSGSFPPFAVPAGAS